MPARHLPSPRTAIRLLAGLLPLAACFTPTGSGSESDTDSLPATTHDPSTGTPAQSGGATTSGPADTTTTTGAPVSTGTTAVTTGPEPVTTGSDETSPDTSSDATTGVPTGGCRKIDVLFVLDGSPTMWQERNALAALDTFEDLVDTLRGLNGWDIDLRIGVTTANDDLFITPPCWQEPDPWIASPGRTSAEIAEAFNCAVSAFGQAEYEAPTGCEHALTSAVDLLDPDVAGFVRDDALLALVLLTDVDDYGAYDQEGGNTCGAGCAIPPMPLPELHARLVDVKLGRAEGLAAVVVAGNPGADAGLNVCNQPGSCNCDGFDCDAYHATRLYDFTALLGERGVTADICAGPSAVTTLIDDAFQSSIALACAGFR